MGTMSRFIIKCHDFYSRYHTYNVKCVKDSEHLKIKSNI